MSERQRVLLALQGKRFPRPGDVGLFTARTTDGAVYARVEVLRVSPTGQTIWTRFVAPRTQLGWLGAQPPPHRWWRVPDNEFLRLRDQVLYRAGFDAKRAPTGEISFPHVLPADTL